jgi:hypothetical protein
VTCATVCREAGCIGLTSGARVKLCAPERLDSKGVCARVEKPSNVDDVALSRCSGRLPELAVADDSRGSPGSARGSPEASWLGSRPWFGDAMAAALSNATGASGPSLLNNRVSPTAGCAASAGGSARLHVHIATTAGATSPCPETSV